MAGSSKAVWFPDWSEKLQDVRLPAAIRQRYRLAIIRYLQFCKQSHQQATVESARAFMESVQAKRLLGVSLLATRKEALNWFFKEGRKQSQDVLAGRATLRRGRTPWTNNADATERVPPRMMTDVPKLGAADMGKTDWERALVRELRMRHYQWRTEQTYRQWSWRFANWLRARKPAVENATADDVRGFLEQLAVRQRVSASSQKQALNALVFLLRPLRLSP